VKRASLLVLVLIAASCANESARKPPAGVFSFGAPVSEALDPDVAFLGDDCLACHSADLIRQQRLTDKQWAKSLEKMRTWGAPTEQDNVEPLLLHLVAAHSRDAGSFVPQTLSADEARSLFVREADGGFSGGDAGRGRALYGDRCAPCHADDARGGTMGVALAGRHCLDRAFELAAIIRAGRGRMPAYEDATDAEVADVLAYLRSLPAY